MRKIQKLAKEENKNQNWYQTKKAKVGMAVASFFALIGLGSCQTEQKKIDYFPNDALTAPEMDDKDMDKIEDKNLNAKIKKILKSQTAPAAIPQSQPLFSDAKVDELAKKVTKDYSAFEKMADIYKSMKKSIDFAESKDKKLAINLDSLNDKKDDIKNLKADACPELYQEIQKAASYISKLVLSRAGMYISEKNYDLAKGNTDLADILSKHAINGKGTKKHSMYKIVESANKEIKTRNDLIKKENEGKDEKDQKKEIKELEESLYGLGQAVYESFKDKEVKKLQDFKNVKNSILEKVISDYKQELKDYFLERIAGIDDENYDFDVEKPKPKTIEDLFKGLSGNYDVNNVKALFNLSSALVDKYISENAIKLKDMEVEAANFEKRKEYFALDLKLAVVSYLIKTYLPSNTGISGDSKEFAKPEVQENGINNLLGAGYIMYQTPEEKESGEAQSKPSTGKKKGFGGN